MAFGSTTTRTRTKTNTKTRTRIKTTSRSSTKQVATLVPSSPSSSGLNSSPPNSSDEATRPSSSSRRKITRKSTDLTEEEEEDDPDFGNDLKEEVRMEQKELKQGEREKKLRAKRKQYKDNGEELPQDLKPNVKGGKKGKGKKKQVELKPEEKALLEGIEPGIGRTVDEQIKWDNKGRGKAKEEEEQSEQSDDSISEKPTKPTFDWSYKKKETEKRNKIKFEPIFFEAGGEFSGFRSRKIQNES